MALKWSRKLRFLQSLDGYQHDCQGGCCSGSVQGRPLAKHGFAVASHWCKILPCWTNHPASVPTDSESLPRQPSCWFGLWLAQLLKLLLKVTHQVGPEPSQLRHCLVGRKCLSLHQELPDLS